MLQRLLVWALSRYFGGKARSWMYVTGALFVVRAVRSVLGRRELVDLSNIKKGESIMIEHLPISHKRQIKELKRDKRKRKRNLKKLAKGLTV